MSIIFLDGFDHYASTAIAAKWEHEQNQIGAMNSATPFGSGQSLFLPNVQSYVSHVLSANYTTLIAGVAFNFTSGVAFAPWNIITFIDNGTVQFNVAIGSTQGIISAYRNTTLLSSSTARNFHIGWHYLEVSVTFHATAGAYTINVDGTQVLTASSVNTSGSGNAFASWVRLGNSTMFTGTNFVSNVLYDDMYLLSSSGSSNNAILGQRRIYTLLPNGVGSSSQFTRTGGTASGNYTAVNEVVVDADTSYVSDSNATDKDSYTYADLPSNVTSINAIQVNQWSRKDDVAARGISPYLKNGASTFTDSTVYSLTSVYADYVTPYDVSPITSSAFTTTEINALEFGTVLSL